DLLPTKTGCVKGNVPGLAGEYRNGALMIQALDASDVKAGFVFDATNEQYVANSAALHSPHGYATKGLLWESTVFWHWDGGCYGEPDYFEDLYDNCLSQGLGGCTLIVEDPDGGGGGDGGIGGVYPPDPPEVPPVETDPGHAVTTTAVGGTSDTGRLFWKELVPE
ncbi:MAG: hypothetical protein ACE1ZA_14010, partial [Pseudomonadales bacterium]